VSRMELSCSSIAHLFLMRAVFAHTPARVHPCQRYPRNIRSLQALLVRQPSRRKSCADMPRC
jgi:hypothetical protein